MPLFDRQTEAELFDAAASDLPTGLAGWTQSLLAGEVLRLDIVETVCHETLRGRLGPAQPSCRPNMTACTSLVWKTSWP